MQIAIDILNLNKGDEIISSPMSCIASHQPILNNRLRIIWADIDPSTGTLDPEDVRKRITARTKAIVHYHWCGYPGYVDEINEISRQFGVAVIEDATEAFGAEFQNKKIGNTGSDLVCFSFQPVRLPNSIEGGAIAFQSNELFQKAALIRDYGINRRIFRDRNGEISKRCDIFLRGYNAMMNEICGWMGSVQMDHIEKLLEKQWRHAVVFDAVLKNSKTLSTIKRRKQTQPSFWVYSMLSKNKLSFMRECRRRGITVSNVHLRNDFYTIFGEKTRSHLKGVNDFSKRQVNIPSGWWLTKPNEKIIIDLLSNA
jgi:dTDP-4-amino-4,6-dideoxygalactose transaminase